MRFLFLPVVLLLLLGATDAPSERPALHGVEAPADTVRYAIESGKPLVVALPGDPAWTFRALRTPAMSWLVGRSFFWKTLPAERGREIIHIERRTGGEARDTLVLVVDVGTP